MNYRIDATERDGRWTARARRTDNGDPFGIECSAETEAAAIARLTAWLDWQREHAAALEELQQAEQTYHRAGAGRAFVSASEGPSAVEIQKESLAAVESARVRLDEIRARKPEQ